MEMHIEVLQGLQKVDSYQQDMFEAPEVDLQLNKHQERFIDELFGKEFEDKQIRLDYVRSLIVKNHSLQVFVPASTDALYEDNMGYAVMPPDYLYLVNDRSKIVTSISKCEDLTTIVTNPTIAEYVSVLPFPTVNVTTAPFYTGFEILKTESSIETAIYSMPTGFVGYIVDKDAKFMLINDSLEKLNRTLTGTRVYWEDYRGVHYHNSYVFVRDDADWTQVKINSYTNDDPAVLDVSTSATFTVTNYLGIALSSDTTDQTTTYADNGMTEGDKLYDLNKNEYYKTSIKEPISAMSDNFLHVYRDKSFIITDVLVDYVRKPRQISLLLDQSCELQSSGARAEVVDRTIQYFKLLIENPVYREFQQDNIIKNQNSITNG